MKQFKIYEIPGVKIGATDRWPKRVIEQGYRPEECRVLFETDVLKLASSMERVLQKRHGYRVDKNRYETIYNANHGRVVSGETRVKMSNAAIKTHVAIAADPVRSAQRSQRKSEAHAAIAADPVRAAQRSKRISEAAIKAHAMIAADPVKSAKRRQHMLEAQLAIASDPVRAAQKSKRISEAKYKATSQIDPVTGIIVGVFRSTVIAGWLVGYQSGGNISGAKRSSEIKKGFRWK